MKLKMILFAVITFAIGSGVCFALGKIEIVTKPPLFKEFLFTMITILWLIGNAVYAIKLSENL